VASGADAFGWGVSAGAAASLATTLRLAQNDDRGRQSDDSATAAMAETRERREVGDESVMN
jgi:hypothetical protein